jgi:hypothetical protein
MKIPSITEFSPELREALERYDQLIERERTVSQRYRELMSMKANGRFSGNDSGLVDLVLAGKDMPDVVDVDSEIHRAKAEWQAIEAANEIQQRKIYELKAVAERKLCDSLRPNHDRLMTRLCKSLAETHAVYVELFRMKRHLANNGHRFGGLFAVEPEFLDIPTDKTTDLADFFREAKKAGYVSSVPAEFA